MIYPRQRVLRVYIRFNIGPYIGLLTNDFNTHSQRQTHGQVWIRLMILPQEYWHVRTLLEIAGAIGRPLTIDTATQKRIFWSLSSYFSGIFYEIMVEQEGLPFKLEVVYEWLSDYCLHCQMIGHDVMACRWLHPKQIVEKIDQGKKNILSQNVIRINMSKNIIPMGFGPQDHLKYLLLLMQYQLSLMQNMSSLVQILMLQSSRLQWRMRGCTCIPWFL
jgi:hypothetical protein